MYDVLPSMRMLLAFDSVVRHLSFSKAAEELNLTASAVSHQIGNLEALLGCALFRRSSQGVSLTPAGTRYHEGLAEALTSIAHAAMSARNEEGIEVLRIHSSPSFASLWLMPRLNAFLESNPNIRLHMTATHTPSDFSREDIDIDIRYGAIRWPGLEVETIFPEEIVPLASPTFLAKRQIRTPEDLLGHPLILSEFNVVQWQQWFPANKVSSTPSEFSLRFDRTTLALDAATQGLGIALESAQLARRMVESGAVAYVFSDHKGIRVQAHHVVFPRSHLGRPRVTRFLSWLRSCARNRQSTLKRYS